MEHRIGRRIVAGGGIELWQGESAYGSFPLLNVGRGGACFQCRGQPFRTGDILTVKLDTSRHSHFVKAGQNSKLKAMVVHRSNSVTGLMWVGEDEAFFAVLENMLAA